MDTDNDFDSDYHHDRMMDERADSLLATPTFAPFARLAKFPECPTEELRLIAHAILAAHCSADVFVGLRMARRITGLDASRWLYGSAFLEYTDGDGCLVWDELQPLAAAYLGE